MGLWGVIMVAANAAQLAVWGKQALESEQGKAAVSEIKKKAGEAGDGARAAAVVAGTVANEAGKVITEKTRPIRHAAASQIEKLAERIERATSPPTDEEVQAEIDRAAEVADSLGIERPGSRKPKVDIESDEVEIRERRAPPDLGDRQPPAASDWDQ